MAKSKAPSAEFLAEVVKDLVTLHTNRLKIISERELRLYQQNAVSFPEDAENPQSVLSGTVDQQLSLWEGLFTERPSLVLPVEDTLSGEEQARLQDIQNLGNALPWLLERQGRPVWASAKRDLGLHGHCVIRADADLPAMAAKMPDREATDDAGQPKYPKTKEGMQAYSKARTATMKTFGLGTEQGPLSWTRVPVSQVFWEDHDRAPGVAVVAEVKWRKANRLLKELGEDDRTKSKLPKLRKKVEEKVRGDKAALAKSYIPYIVVEGDGYCSHLVFVDALTTTDVLQDPTVLAKRLLDGAKDADLVDQYPLLLGRPQYVVYDGLTTNSSDPGLQKKGICDAMSGLIDRYDAMLSYTMTEYVNFGAFPVVFLLEDVVRDQYGNPIVAGEDDAGTASTGIDLRPGFHKVTPFRPGQKIQFGRPESLGPDGVRMKDDLRHLIGLHGIPDAVSGADASASSGYEMNQLISTVRSRYKPQIEGVQRGFLETLLLLFELMRVAYKGETVHVAAPGPDEGTVQWLKLDVKELENLAIPMECVYEFKATADDLAELQAYHLATDEPNPLMTQNRGRQRYGKLKDPEAEASQITVQRYKASDRMRNAVELAALKKFDKALAEREAAAQGAFTADQLAQATPAVAQTVVQMTQPGMPGYNAAQRFQQGQQPQPAAAPQQTSTQGPQLGGPPPAPMPRGRAPGQARRPGGPRMKGGLG